MLAQVFSMLTGRAKAFMQDVSEKRLLQAAYHP